MTVGICAGTGGMGRLFGRLAAMLFLAFGLSACAIPPAVSLISMAADGVLLAATGKSKTDHGLSIATGRDCSTLRVLDGEDVCQDIVIAQTEPLPAAISRELDALRAAAPRDRHRATTDVAMNNADAAMNNVNADVAMNTAFRAAPSQAIVLAAAPRPAPAVLAEARIPPAAVQLAALRAPQTGTTPGRIKLDRPDTARAAVSVAAKARFGLAKNGVAVAKNGKHLTQTKGKRFAALKNKRVAGLRAKQPRLGAAGTHPAPATLSATVPKAKPSFVAPAQVSRAMPATDGDQLALAP